MGTFTLCKYMWMSQRGGSADNGEDMLFGSKLWNLIIRVKPHSDKNFFIQIESGSFIRKKKKT